MIRHAWRHLWNKRLLHHNSYRAYCDALIRLKIAFNKNITFETADSEQMYQFIWDCRRFTRGELFQLR